MTHTRIVFYEMCKNWFRHLLKKKKKHYRKNSFSYNMIYVHIIFVVACFSGFTTSKIACCGQGPNNGLGLCTPVSNLCPNRDLYVFWDNYHPSERANRLIVQQIMNGPTEYMSPMNLSTVMALDTMIWWFFFFKRVTLFILFCLLPSYLIYDVSNYD